MMQFPLDQDEGFGLVIVAARHYLSVWIWILASQLLLYIMILLLMMLSGHEIIFSINAAFPGCPVGPLIHGQVSLDVMFSKFTLFQTDNNPFKSHSTESLNRIIGQNWFSELFHSIIPQNCSAELLDRIIWENHLTKLFDSC